MNFYSGAQEELRGDEAAGTQADRAVLAKPPRRRSREGGLGAEGTRGGHLPWGLAWAPARCHGCRTRCSRRKAAARGAGMVTLLLPEGCAGDSGVALPGQGAVHGPRAASGTGGGWGGAQPSVGR